MAWYDLDEINKKHSDINKTVVIDRTFDNLVESKKDKLLKKDKKLYIQFLERQYVRVSILKELIRLPKKGELLRLVTQQNFNAFALFLFILQKKDIDEVFLTTYSIDKNTITAIEKIISEELDIKLTIMIASLVKHDKPLLRERLMNLAKVHKNISFIECFNHTKIIAVKTKDKNYYVMEGSGNLSANARIESYLFDNNKESYDFHKNWIEEIINEVKGTKILKSKNCKIIK